MKRVILNIGNLPALVLTLATVLALFCLTSSYSYAEVVTVNGTNGTATASANASVNVSAACSFTSHLDAAHTATIAPGTYSGASGSEYANGIGKTTFTVICNDSGGYSIYAIGYANEEFGNNKLLATVNGSLAPAYDIVTGTATSGDTSNWAMKLTAVSGTYAPSILDNYNNYHNVPSTYAKVATFASATDGSVGSQMEATYGAYISGTQPAGTYNGKVKYTMVHPASEVPLQPQPSTAGCISYWPNASGVTDTMGNQCSLGNNASATLWASNFQRSGYGFAGWTDKFDWVLNANDANGNGTGANAGYHIYGPNADITTPADMTTKGLSLYAVWVLNAGNLQSWNGCSTLNAGNVTALTDQRDNNTYAIAKLADGNCWMIENLRLDNDTTGNSDGSLAQGYASGFIGLANPETADFSNSTTANSLYSTTNITGRNQGYRFPRYNNQNTSSPATNMTAWNNNANTYSVGNWYTWSAAVADTSFYGTNNQTIANTSICPTGWKLPAGGNKNNTTVSDFWKLSVATIGTEPANTSSQTQPYYTGSTEGANASNVLRSYPNSFIYSGRFGVSSPSSRGSSGNYWSSTVSNSSLSYNLNLGSSNVYPGTDYGNKGSGRSVRCTISGS